MPSRVFNLAIGFKKAESKVVFEFQLGVILATSAVCGEYDG